MVLLEISDSAGRVWKLTDYTLDLPKAERAPHAGDFDEVSWSPAIGDFVNFPFLRPDGGLGNFCYRRVR